MIPEELLEMGLTYRVLEGFDPQQLRKLVPIAEHKQYKTGEIVFPIGGRSSYFHLIVSGDVALEQVARGEPLRVQTLHRGDAMGWSALTDDARAHFQARALSPVTTVAFPSHALRDACENDTGLGYVLMKRLVEVIGERLDATRARVAAQDPWDGAALRSI